MLTSSKVAKQSDVEALFPCLDEFIELHTKFLARLKQIVGEESDENYYRASFTPAVPILKAKKELYKEYSVKISSIFESLLPSFLDKNKKAAEVFQKQCGKKGQRGKSGFVNGVNSTHF